MIFARNDGADLSSNITLLNHLSPTSFKIHPSYVKRYIRTAINQQIGASIYEEGCDIVN
ncbi:uncharacterized protein Dvir_GJ26599 [Drosophila virilis]|uniref:Uncharacterized protein n=1 Tax=Drosophila virilis TaxID=7244 RepID=A0A0Q9WXX9_DROVI|nr:uncharacterized protein Dvir_GJ26599 [Drosophila virilis]